MPRINAPAELEAFRKDIISQRDPGKPCIAVCTGTGCLALGASNVVAALREEINKQGLETEVVDIRETGCPGFCERGPLLVIYPEEICYLQVQPEDAGEIISQTVVGKKVIDRSHRLPYGGHVSDTPRQSKLCIPPPWQNQVPDCA